MVMSVKLIISIPSRASKAVDFVEKTNRGAYIANGIDERSIFTIRIGRNQVEQVAFKRTRCFN